MKACAESVWGKEPELGGLHPERKGRSDPELLLHVCNGADHRALTQSFGSSDLVTCMLGG